MLNLAFSLHDAVNNEHPQQTMKRIGISYLKAVPQSVLDSWWFFGCSGNVAPLPSFLTVIDGDISRLVGHGLSESDVRLLKTATLPSTAITRHPDNQGLGGERAAVKGV